MAIVFEKQKKTQRNLIFALIFILLLTFAIVRWRLSGSGGSSTDNLPSSVAEKKVNLDISILKNPALREFQPFTRIVGLEEQATTTASAGKPEKVGRTNPFISPY